MSSVCKLSTLCPVRATFCVTDRSFHFSLCLFKILNDVFKSIESYRQLNIAYVVRLVHQLVYCYRPTEGAGLTLTNSPTLTPIEGTSICSLKKDGGKKSEAQRQLVCCDWWVGGVATWLWCSEQRDSASGAVAQSGRSTADAETSQQGEPALVVPQPKGSTLPSTDSLWCKCTFSAAQMQNVARPFQCDKKN